MAAREDLVDASSVGWHRQRVPSSQLKRAATVGDMTGPAANDEQYNMLLNFSSNRSPTRSSTTVTSSVRSLPALMSRSQSSSNLPEKARSLGSFGSFKAFLSSSSSASSSQEPTLLSQSSFKTRQASLAKQGSFTASMKQMLQRGSSGPERIAVARSLGKRHDNICIAFRPAKKGLLALIKQVCACGEQKSARVHDVIHVCRSCGDEFTALSNSNQSGASCKVHSGQVICSHQSKTLGNKYFWSCCLQVMSAICTPHCVMPCGADKEPDATSRG